MNSELINALISQIGNIVGIPLAAVLAVWQVKKGFTSKRKDEVNEKSFGLCCELFDLVSRNESYNKEVTDKITKMVKERNDSQKLLHPEILRMISEIETYKKILNRIDEKDKLACRREKKIMKRLRKDYEILCAYVSNEDNRSLIGSAALVGLVIEIWRFWKNKSPNSFWRFVKEQKRKIKEEEKENT